MKGVITGRRRKGDLTEYTVFDGERYRSVTSQKRIRGRSVLIKDEDIEELKENVLEEVKKRFFSRVRADLDLPQDLKPIKRAFEELWKEIAFLKIVGDKPLVYYDPDADGIVSMLLLSEALRLNARPLNPWQLIWASGLIPDLHSPLTILLDLGSSEDLRPGVSLLYKLGRLAVIDHHPSTAPPPAHILLNPALQDPDLSRFTTAILVSLLVSTWVKREKWVRVAAAGDRSPVIQWSEEDRKRALALELSVDVFGYNHAIWKQVLDTDLWKPLWELYLERIEHVDAISEKEELEVDGKRVLIVSYPHPGFHYPHRGKVASWYQEKGYDIVIVKESTKEKVYTVSLRGNVNFLPLVEETKRRGLADGWGHPNAVTLKTRDPSALTSFLLAWLEEKDKNISNAYEKR